MKKAALFALVAFALISFGCGGSGGTASTGKAGFTRQNAVNELVAGLIYFQDPSTSRCYAYYRGDASSGAPVLAPIACQQVPPALLRRSNQ